MQKGTNIVFFITYLIGTSVEKFEASREICLVCSARLILIREGSDEGEAFANFSRGRKKKSFLTPAAT
jgi:hypothetical protein